MNNYVDIGLEWRPLRSRMHRDEAERIENKMRSVLRGWQGTPYMSGQSVRGVASDCIGFAFGVVDDLYGRKPVERPILPADASMHNREGALRTVRELRKLYAPNVLTRSGAVEPGDIIVVGSAGPGHVMLVGPDRRAPLWHCNVGTGVVFTGLWLPADWQYFGAYRISDKEKWV